MAERDKRLFARQPGDLPMRYSIDGGRKFIGGSISNTSPSGVCFQSERIIEPGCSVRIVMDRHWSGFGAAGERRYLHGTVRWCGKRGQGAPAQYGVGVMLVACSLSSNGENAKPICFSCDLCGRFYSCDIVRRSEKALILCPDCHRYLSEMPDGPTKRAILRVSMGNVV